MTKRILSVVLVLSMIFTLGSVSFTADAASWEYDDVPTYHWAYDYIALARCLNIMVGVGNNKFEPDSNIQACHYLRALCNVNNASCTRNHYYYNSTGYINRLDAICAIWNNANCPYYGAEVSSRSHAYLYNYIYRFPELNNSKYYTWRNGRKCLNLCGKAITWSLYTGILSGSSDGKLHLNDYLTRAQTAKILVDYYYNYSDYLH